MKQVLHCCALFCANKVDAEDAEEYANSSNQHRSDDSLQLHFRSHSEGSSTKGCSRKDRAAIALIQISTHTSNITHIITYIISNSSRVARVILWDISLNLSYDISTNVSSLGIDTTTYTSKESLCRSTHSEGKHCCRDSDECHLVAMIEMTQNEEPDCNIQQAETYDSKTHYGTTAEGNLQATVKTLAGSIRSTSAGVSSRLHSEESGEAREEATSKEGKWHPRILHLKHISHK